MLRLRHAKRLTAAAALGAALLLGQRALAQSPAELAPADTAVFIHIHDPADWLGELTEGPLGDRFRDQIEQAEGIGDVLAALGMSFDQFTRAYAGEDVVLISQGGDDDAPGVIFTKASEDDRAHAIESLFLQRQGSIADHPVYVGPDGNGYFVMMDNWVAMCDLNAVDYLHDILEQDDNASRLADTEHYARWTAELPGDRSLTVLAFESPESRHAIGVVRKGKGLDATYLGVSPDFDELLGLLGQTSVAEFGPLPGDTIAAVSFNLAANDEMREQFQGLDALLRGKSFVNDVLPKLEPPTLLFLGAVDGDAVEPAVGVQVPVLGLALKMNDTSVAEDLKIMLDGLMVFANFAVAELQAGPVPFRNETYKQASFQVAEIGRPIAQGVGFAELAPIQIVYGRVGDYYIVCTQEAFFKRCVDASEAGQAMLIDVEGPSHRLAKTPVLAMTAQPDGFGELLRSWADLLQEKGLPDALGAQVGATGVPEELFDVIQLLQQYALLKVQVWTGDDGLVIGRAQLTPPQ